LQPEIVMRSRDGVIVLRDDKMTAGRGPNGIVVERLIRWYVEARLTLREGLKGSLCKDGGEPGKVVGYPDGVVLNGCRGRVAVLWPLVLSLFWLTGPVRLSVILVAFTGAVLGLCILSSWVGPFFYWTLCSTMATVGISKRGR
jgi:hypothetical protein